MNSVKIAIVHDYLIEFGGAERVLLALHEIYPDAPIYVSVYRKSCLGKFAEKFENAKVIQSWFGFLPFADKLISPFRFLIPAIWGGFDLTGYDLIISSASWAVTKGFGKPACRQAGKKGAKEICYCHTPPRYLYGYDTSRRFKGLMGKLVGFYGLIVNHFMLQYDFKRAQNVDYFIANSEEVKKRIEKFYRRDSTIIYPPVELSKLDIKSSDRTYYLTGGRLTAAKNFDMVIHAFNKLGLPLLIYGSGPLEKYLKSIAKDNMDSAGPSAVSSGSNDSPRVKFLGKVTDGEMAKLYGGAKAFILAQKDEDFGMTAVEAMSFGTPVIAYKGGGYLESVVEAKTGLFFDPPSHEASEGRGESWVNSLVDAVRRFEKVKFKSEDCVNRAKKFSKERFVTEIKDFVNSKIKT